MYSHFSDVLHRHECTHTQSDLWMWPQEVKTWDCSAMLFVSQKKIFIDYKRERESYQISLNFKILVFIFLTFSPPVLENVTLRYLPLGGALILVFWLWLHPVCVQSLIHCCKLSRSPMPFSSAPSTQTPSNTNLLNNAHSMHSNKYSVLGLNSRMSLKESN